MRAGDQAGGTVTMGHGGGGRESQELVRDVFLRHLADPELARLNDAAAISVLADRLAVSTDSFVVTPPVFPGGDIGALAVHGTVNDLAMLGARPVCLTVGFILEEGLQLDLLDALVASMAAAAAAAKVRVVAGDTKVVEHGSGDGVFINTTGVGEIVVDPAPAAERVQAGDAVVINGPVAAHGIAVLMARNQFAFRSDIESDSAPLWRQVRALHEAGIELRALRDPTRGGLATVLNEVADAAGLGIVVQEAAVPVAEAVRGACDLLGLDPLYVANEGKLVAFVPARQAQAACDVLGAVGDGEAAVIGEATARREPGRVILNTAIGGRRVLDVLAGDQLPRIC